MDNFSFSDALLLYANPTAHRIAIHGNDGEKNCFFSIFFHREKIFTSKRLGMQRDAITGIRDLLSEVVRAVEGVSAHFPDVLNQDMFPKLSMKENVASPDMALTTEMIRSIIPLLEKEWAVNLAQFKAEGKAA